ncbi:O-antigen ligase family protein [Amycolatopsis cihanbeyliensis]|uniref:O-antigen ligase n=1 Tax=Amycolatopsis cihanbeyliensis TaxID=1128664 RepID=A0A542DFI0_AMYCI|nr:O-antigen ligase family protein [Amycolatopsis cihanbeyliensis]TQJ01837.1 O-antigen ligase [Amycolatopsis cihanbeyliensis]
MAVRDPRSAAQRADGATLVCLYAAVALLVPARLVLSGIPMSITPATVCGLGLGLLWFCGHLVTTLNTAKGRNAARTALFLFIVSQLATYGYATMHYLPADELDSADRTIVLMMGASMAGLAACDGIRGLARLELVLKAILGLITVVAAIGILQFLAGIDLTQYLNLPGLQAVTPDDFVLERADLRRPAGTTGHPIEFGVVCAVGMPLAAHYAFTAQARHTSAWRWWVCLALTSCGAMMSLSRSAMLGLALAAIVLLIGWPRKRRIQALVVGTAFVVLMRFLVPGLMGTLYGLFAEIGNDSSITARTDDYAVAAVQIAEHPLLGRGLGTYLPSKYGPLDNQYLGTLVQNGFVGLFALLGVFVVGAYAALRARGTSRNPHVRDLALTLVASLSVLALGAATFDLLAFPMATTLAFLLCGAAGALLRAVRQEHVAAGVDPPTVRVALSRLMPGRGGPE